MKKIIKLILIVVWMGLIFTFSQDNGINSTKKSDSFIIHIYKIFNKNTITTTNKEKVINKYVYPVRKLAHLTEYLILGILVISFINEYILINNKAILIALIICILYAISDEIHQLFVIGRSAKILDVFIDTIGSYIGIIIYKITCNKIFRRKTYE